MSSFHTTQKCLTIFQSTIEMAA